MWPAFQPSPVRGWADVATASASTSASASASASTSTTKADVGVSAPATNGATSTARSASAAPRYQTHHVHQPNQAAHLASLLAALPPPSGLSAPPPPRSESPRPQAFLPPPSSAAVRLPTAVVFDGDVERTSFRRWKWDAASLSPLPKGRARHVAVGGRRREVSAAAMDALETETMLLATMRLGEGRPAAVAAAAAFRALAPFLAPEERERLQGIFGSKGPVECLKTVVEVAERAGRQAGYGYGGRGYSASPGSFAAVAGGAAAGVSAVAAAPGAVVRPGKNHGHLMAAGNRTGSRTIVGVSVAAAALDGLGGGADVGGSSSGGRSPSASPVGAGSPVPTTSAVLSSGDTGRGSAAMFGHSLFNVGDSVLGGSGTSGVVANGAGGPSTANFDFAPAVGPGDDGNSSGGGGSVGGRSSSSGMGSHRGSGGSLWGGPLPLGSSASAWASVVANGTDYVTVAIPGSAATTAIVAATSTPGNAPSPGHAQQANGSTSGSPSDAVQWSSAIERGVGIPRLDVNAKEYRPNFRTQ